MNTKNLPLIVGISLPIIFIILISAIVFIPSLSMKPQYDFIYSTEDSSYGYSQNYKNTYIVTGGRIAVQALPADKDIDPAYKGDSPALYLYDIKNNSSHKISFEEATKYALDQGPSSPDGYTVKYEYNNDGIFGLFGSNGDGSGYFIEKSGSKKELTGMSDATGTYYQGRFKLIGWIK